MPVNIASLVTPTYDAAIQVPLDGEYANSAALQAVVLPVANRVEYLRQVLEDAPWREVSVFEDFLATVHEVDADEYYADTAWNMNSDFSGYTKTADPLSGVTLGSLGVLKMANSSGGALASRSFKSEGCIEVGSFRRATARVLLGTVIAGMGFHLGIDGVGGNELTAVVFAPATSPNWLIRNAATALTVDTGVVVAANTFYTLDLVHDGASGWTVSIDGAAAVAANPAGTPALTTPVTFAWDVLTPAAGANRFCYVDFVYFRAISAGRVV